MDRNSQTGSFKKFTPEKETQLIEYKGDDQIVTFKQKQAEIDAICQPEIKILTGFGKINEWVSHFEAGDVVTISGPTKSGKTLFAQTLTHNFYLQEIFSLWFSYELTAKQFLACFTHLPDPAYMPKKMTTGALEWIEERIYEARLKTNNGLQAVFIDHLHFIVDMVSRQNMSIQIGTVLRNLKRIAQEQKVCIFLIAHTGKIPKGEDPDGENIRDSSFIRQESDTVFMIWRLKEKNQARIMVDVCRRTGAFKKLLTVKKENGLLFEIAEYIQEPESEKEEKKGGAWWNK